MKIVAEICVCSVLYDAAELALEPAPDATGNMPGNIVTEETTVARPLPSGPLPASSLLTKSCTAK